MSYVHFSHKTAVSEATLIYLYDIKDQFSVFIDFVYLSQLIIDKNAIVPSSHPLSYFATSFPYCYDTMMEQYQAMQLHIGSDMLHQEWGHPKRIMPKELTPTMTTSQLQ